MRTAMGKRMKVVSTSRRSEREIIFEIYAWKWMAVQDVQLCSAYVRLGSYGGLAGLIK